jgi:glycosyltransferase involved in cell wall biosynthesis
MAGPRNFTVCVIGHLRPVKDPFRAALAARQLPPSSRIRVLHVGGAMSEGMAARARAEMNVNHRYLWLGEQPRWRTLRIMARSHLCVLSSRLEGGANVLSESIVASAPVVASRIPGTVGILGEDYPGYFTVGDTRELRRLLIRAETDPDFLSLLRSKCEGLAELFEPEREKKACISDIMERFALLDGVTQQGLLRHCPTARNCTFRHKSTIYSQGTRCNYLFFIISPLHDGLGWPSHGSVRRHE